MALMIYHPYNEHMSHTKNLSQAPCLLPFTIGYQYPPPNNCFIVFLVHSRAELVLSSRRRYGNLVMAQVTIAIVVDFENDSSRYHHNHNVHIFSSRYNSHPLAVHCPIFSTHLRPQSVDIHRPPKMTSKCNRHSIFYSIG